jgi:hypothetical protein
MGGIVDLHLFGAKWPSAANGVLPEPGRRSWGRSGPTEGANELPHPSTAADGPLAFVRGDVHARQPLALFLSSFLTGLPMNAPADRASVGPGTFPATGCAQSHPGGG